MLWARAPPSLVVVGMTADGPDAFQDLGSYWQDLEHHKWLLVVLHEILHSKWLMVALH